MDCCTTVVATEHLSRQYADVAYFLTERSVNVKNTHDTRFKVPLRHVGDVKSQGRRKLKRKFGDGT